MKKILLNAFYLFFPLLIGGIVALIINPYIDYTSLDKPFLAPPKFAFPLFWTIIYLLLGISYWLLKRQNLIGQEEKQIYYFELAVNALWSVIFFVFKWRLIAIAWILLLDVLVILMLVTFYRKYKLAAYLNYFYLAWVLFATYLTIGIYLLN